jgi:hypothetical protein
LEDLYRIDKDKLTLWEVVGGDDVTAPPAERTDALKKWRVKTGKAMFVLKTTIEEVKTTPLSREVRDATTPKGGSVGCTRYTLLAPKCQLLY